jgi:glutamyl-Q tRNA(Asp) synthetase
MAMGATAGPIAEAGAPVATLTRFAPAPTGYLHLGHVANAVWTWGLAASDGAQVLLRIEDHDRQRCRPEYDEALLEDLDWLGFRPDLGPIRQSDSESAAAYAEALERLRADGLVYGCDCTRSTFVAWAETNGRWTGPGCPGDCRSRGGSGDVPRVALGDGSEVWSDLLAGPCRADVAPSGDLAIRDRHGNWTYGFCVVVDDLRQGIDLVVRGRDLLEATAGQIRLARVLGRDTAPSFAHHALITGPDGHKLSKSSGDTGVRELRAAGRSRAEVIEMATAATAFPSGDQGGDERGEIGVSHTS